MNACSNFLGNIILYTPKSTQALPWYSKRHGIRLDAREQGTIFSPDPPRAGPSYGSTKAAGEGSLRHPTARDAEYPTARAPEFLLQIATKTHAVWMTRAARPSYLTYFILKSTMAIRHSKRSEKKKLATRLQYGALPYRKTKNNGIEFLLITSRETKRWIIPKGWPMKGMKPCDSAAQEAYEEAGVRGTVSCRPLGKYIYDKRLGPTKMVPCEVQVYGLRVRRLEESWLESDQRDFRWCKPEEAVAMADDAGLGALIERFAGQHAS